MSADQNRINEFLRLHTRHETRLHAFILSLLSDWNDAEEVMQETATILWSKFDQFDPETNYFAWACQVARFEVKRYLRRQKRGRLLFNDEFLQTVAEETVEMDEELVARQRALADCVEKLSPTDREMIRLRYEDGATAATIGERLSRSVHAIYKAMKRIRRTLYDCVGRTLAKEKPA